MAKIEFLSPVGRLVFGGPFNKQTTDFDGKPLLIRSGPNVGQPTQKYECGLAIAKNSPELPAFWALIVRAAREGFPQLFDAAGNCIHPQFSYKMMDGDGIDTQGKPNNQKEGYAGHYIFRFASAYMPRVFRQGRYAPADMLTEANSGEIRRGYFYRIAGTMEGNGQTSKPGVYLNLSMVELVAIGDEITSGPNAVEVFGGAPAPAALPAGARALPTAPPASSIPGMPAQAAPVAMAMPGMTAAPAAMPGAQMAPAALAMPVAPVAVMPSTTFAAPGGVAMPGAALPLPVAPAALPVAPVVAAGPQMTAKSGGHSYAALIAGGWTDATLRAEGYML